MKSRNAVLCVLAISLGLLVSSPVAAEIVFDSLSGMSYHGARGCCSRTGQTVTLASTSRHVTDIEFWLGTAGASTFIVEFYNMDGPNGVPGSLIWQSPVQTYPYVFPFYNRLILNVDVPEILVPDTFAWTITNVHRVNDTLIQTGLPTIGSLSSPWYYVPASGEWVDDSDWRFGARINAIPEPSCALMLAVGAAIVCQGTRLRSRIIRCTKTR
jgi:hypothetical protein